MKSLISFLACILFAASIYGQSNNGNIQGTVTDQSGAALGGANVTARNIDTGLINSTVSTDAGNYSLPNLLRDVTP